MKLRNPRLISLASWLGAGLVRILLATVRFRHVNEGPIVEPTDTKQGILYAFWHEGMLVLSTRYALPYVHVLISQHADGELIAQICRRLGFGTIRGSTTRGGAEALRKILALGKSDCVVFTPDGPRGPRRQFQMGLVYVAARTGLPIVVAGLAFTRCWRVNSWDRFAIPKPFAKSICIASAPITIPKDSSREALESHRQHLEAELERVTACAERWAASGGDEGVVPASSLPQSPARKAG